MALLIQQDADGTVDLVTSPTGLVQDPGLSTMVLIRLFTWGRAQDDDETYDPLELMGWAGDTYSNPDGYRIAGSRLWLLKGRKATAQTLNLAVELAKSALQPLIDDGIAKSIDVAVRAHDLTTLAITVQLTQPDNLSLWLGPWVFELTGDVNAV